MVDFNTIGLRIKQYREQAHLTQATLAEKLGVSVSYISQIERGIASVSLKRLDEIARFISTTLKTLVSENNTDGQDDLGSEIAERINALPQRDKVQLHAIVRAFIEYN